MNDKSVKIQVERTWKRFNSLYKTNTQSYWMDAITCRCQSRYCQSEKKNQQRCLEFHLYQEMKSITLKIVNRGWINNFQIHNVYFSHFYPLIFDIIFTIVTYLLVISYNLKITGLSATRAMSYVNIPYQCRSKAMEQFYDDRRVI